MSEVSGMWPTAADFRIAWVGDDKPDNTETIEHWLARARDMVEGEVPDIEDRVASGKVTPIRLAGVVIEMVNRVFRNPGGMRSIQGSQSTGGITEQGSTMFAGNRLGQLYLEPEEKAALIGEKNLRGTAFTIRPVISSATTYGGIVL